MSRTQSTTSSRAYFSLIFSFLDPQKVTHLRVLSYQNSSKKGAAARKVISSSALLLAATQVARAD